MSDLFLKPRTIFALQNANGGSLTTGTAVAVGSDLDVRASGNAELDFAALFLLICQWSTVTGIAAGLTIADLYLVPKIDGSNLSQVDTASGSSFIPPNLRAGSFIAAKQPAASTDTYFHTLPVGLMPTLYTPYLLNRSGQTIAANWSLKAITARLQS